MLGGSSFNNRALRMFPKRNLALHCGINCSRRSLLRAGIFGGLSPFFPGLVQATNQAPSAKGFGRAKRCIILFLTGGVSQLDTFDPKNEAPIEVRGEFRPIAT